MPKSKRPITEQRRNPNEMVSHFPDVRISDIRTSSNNYFVRILDILASLDHLIYKFV